MDLTETIFYILELVGTLAFALSGAMLAIKRHLDLFGVIFLGVITAVGGGMIRDILIGNTPPVMFTSVEYVLLAAAASATVFVIAYRSRDSFADKARYIDFVNNIIDAVGLGVFTVTGTRIGMMTAGDNAFMCIFLGVITGIGGGLLRDTISMAVPVVLRKKIYALASIAGGLCYYYMLRLGALHEVSAFTGVAVVCLIRILAARYRWDLPVALPVTEKVE